MHISDDGRTQVRMTPYVDLGELSGLSQKEAERRLEEEGYNELPSEKPRGILAIVLGVIREPMFLLLLGGGGVYLLVGDRQEALILLSFVFVIMGITVYQERRTERTLEALRDLSSPRALVILSLIHISEPTRLGMISYAVFCLKKKNKNKTKNKTQKIN